MKHDSDRIDTLAKLAESRLEIRRLLEPPPRHESVDGDTVEHARASGQFPRSKTMRLLLSGKGIGAVGAVVGGVLLARPALALRLLRLVPASAVARTLAIKAITSLSARHEAAPHD